MQAICWSCKEEEAVLVWYGFGVCLEDFCEENGSRAALDLLNAVRGW
ncbi:MAG: hypothetical protein ABR562_08510 [Thermoplasmatota archaeon]